MLFEDETILREFPPLRAGWAPRGAPAVVPITGDNARRVIFGVLNPFTGSRHFHVAARNGGPDFRDFLSALRGTYRRWDILMLLDHGSSHTAHATGQLARTLRIHFGWLPTACPEDNPIELLWADGKQTVCANRAYADVDEQALQFIAHLTTLTPAAALQRAGVQSANFWLPT